MSRSLLFEWREAVRESELPAMAKLVALALTTWMNGDGRARPSRDTLARCCSISNRTVDKASRDLEAAGFVTVRRTLGGNPGTCTNAYQAHLPVNLLRGEGRSPAKETTVSRERHDTSRERPSPESAKSAESGALHATAAMNGAAANAQICDSCGVGGGHHAEDCTEVPA